MAAKGSADDAVLGLFRYSPPDITRVVVHFYYHDANDRIQ